jgi:hypothetical protein
VTRLALLLAVSATVALGSIASVADAALPWNLGHAGIYILNEADIDDVDPPPYPPGQEVPENFPDPWDNEGITIVTPEGSWTSKPGPRGNPEWIRNGYRVMWQGHPVWVLSSSDWTAESAAAVIPEPPPWAGYADLDNECVWLEFCSQNGLCA